MIQYYHIILLLVIVTHAIDPERVKETINKSKQQVWNEITGVEWVFPTYLGTLFLSEYYFEIQALNLESKFNETHFTQMLLNTQLKDGSWVQVKDAYLPSGQLDSTIFNYWYLKTIGLDVNSNEMKKAREWILKNGGIEKAQTMSKFKLAIFGQYPWKKLFSIPLFIFYKDYNPFYIKDITAQWVYPHMTALAYLQHVQKVYNVGADIKELYIEVPEFIENQFHGQVSNSLVNLVEEMLKQRQPLGSFGGYTISTLLSMLALDDFRSRSNLFSQDIESTMSKGLSFVEFNYFNEREGYQGSLDDGRWWDTILISWALLESGEDKEKLRPVVENMIKKGVQDNGGIAYGYDFEYAPDADDTGLLLAVLSYYDDDFIETINKSKQFLYDIQNADGGFPAFDKGKMGKNPLYSYLFKLAGIADSAEIFDPSSPDVTAHILEGLSKSNQMNDVLLKHSLKYLMNTQESHGSWEGRWGINYIYAAGAVLPALKEINFNLKEKWIQHAVEWLVKHQNEDGGYGETTLSYNDPKKYNGVGVSTVTQTAWGLLGLLAVADDYNVESSIEKCVSYLVTQHEQVGQFLDTSVVGTGHRGLLYLQYPSYARSFPLLSLSRYLRRMNMLQ